MSHLNLRRFALTWMLSMGNNLNKIVTNALLPCMAAKNNGGMRSCGHHTPATARLSLFFCSSTKQISSIAFFRSAKAVNEFSIASASRGRLPHTIVMWLCPHIQYEEWTERRDAKLDTWARRRNCPVACTVAHKLICCWDERGKECCRPVLYLL